MLVEIRQKDLTMQTWQICADEVENTIALNTIIITYVKKKINSQLIFFVYFLNIDFLSDCFGLYFHRKKIHRKQGAKKREEREEKKKRVRKCAKKPDTWRVGITTSAYSPKLHKKRMLESWYHNELLMVCFITSFF